MTPARDPKLFFLWTKISGCWVIWCLVIGWLGHVSAYVYGMAYVYYLAICVLTMPLQSEGIHIPCLPLFVETLVETLVETKWKQIANEVETIVETIVETQWKH